ncbi:MAG: hypothetical protein JJU11_08555 [Candidatus Sumerlaeia bacterium]|nr:hypothetical protein [Candidatus Sumerlaeia bacterium]
MSQSVRLGPFDISLDPRGIRFAFADPSAGVPVRPLIIFHLDEPGKPSVHFTLNRMTPAENGEALDLVGFTTEKVYLSVRVHVKDGEEDPRLVLKTVLQNATEEMNLRLRVQVVLLGEAEPRWLVPGFFYKDNRPEGCSRLFPGFSELGHNPRRLISNYWAFRSDRASIPAVFAWSHGCFGWISTEGVFGQSRELPRGHGISGLFFGVDNGQPSYAVEFPYREAPAKYSFCHEDRTEPEELFINLPVNTPFQTTVELGLGKPDLHAYAKVMKTLYSERQDRHLMRLRAPVEDSEYAAHVGLLRWHYAGASQAIYETAVFDMQFGQDGTHVERPHMHSGWLSGALPAFTLLWAGRESKHNESITAGVAVLNKITSALSPAGTIFPVWTDEAGWACSFGPEDGTAHSRTIAEAILFIIRALNLELKHDTNHPQWTEAVKSTLNYATGAQRDDGAFPSYFDLSVGRPVSYEGAGGLPWIAAVAAGYALLQIPHLKEVATRGGDYYAKMVKDEFLFGSVEDQPLVPTCDDAHWALISYVLLYEVDRDSRWLDLARRAADLALTWRMGYNILFDVETLAARYNLRTRGGDISSVASPTLGPTGLMSYRELIRLAQYTGDDYYRQRAEDARLFAAQMVCRVDGQYNGRFGMVPGQLFHTDWWQPKGMVLSLSHAMAGTLVKYTEMVRRKLDVDSMVVERDDDGDIESYFGEPVMYSDAAMGDYESPAATGTSRPFQIGSALGEALGLRSAGPASPRHQSALSGLLSPEAQESFNMADMEGHDQDSDSTARPPSARQVLSQRGVDVPEEDNRVVPNPFASPEPRGRSSRGLSSDQVPLPDFSSSPVPFPDSPARGEKSEGSDSDEDIEIKYKIF